MMRARRISCTIDGDTFLGTYAAVLVREDPAVRVCYKQAQRTARADERSTGVVARELLGLLVRDDLQRGMPADGAPLRTPAPAFQSGQRSDRELSTR